MKLKMQTFHSTFESWRLQSDSDFTWSSSLFLAMLLRPPLNSSKWLWYGGEKCHHVTTNIDEPVMGIFRQVLLHNESLLSFFLFFPSFNCRNLLKKLSQLSSSKWLWYEFDNGDFSVIFCAVERKRISMNDFSDENKHKKSFLRTNMHCHKASAMFFYAKSREKTVFWHITTKLWVQAGKEAR